MNFFKVLTAIILLFSCAATGIAKSIAIFPGAQGYGVETPGGRGGKILKVSNLNDEGPGSLRSAVEASGPRIVVFEVGGYINLHSELAITNPFITIAGQTAPEPGITLRNRRLRIGTHDVVIQHLRSRPGDAPGKADELDDRDALTIQDFNNPIYNVVIDHCSFSWSVDEVVGLWGYRDKRLSDITISNSIISEGLNRSLHPRGPHSKGLLIGDYSKRVTLIRNLISSSADRNGPLFKGGTSGIVLNNLVYNGGNSYRLGFADDYNAGPSKVTAVGNLWIDGPAYPTRGPVWFNSNVKAGTEIYLSGNKIVQQTGFPVPIVENNTGWGNPVVTIPPLWIQDLKVWEVNQVESGVLANAGARPAQRDVIDERIVREVRTRTGRIIDSPKDVGGWPDLSDTYRPFEIPEDPTRDHNLNAYSPIEEMLHRMAEQVEGR